MSRNTHSLGEDFHFGELSASRVLTEDMTNFSAGLPVEDVLRWMTERISNTESGRHQVGFFSLNAVTLIPSFTIDAVIERSQPHSFLMQARIPGMFANGGVFRINSIIMPSFTMDAIILRPGPTSIIHDDRFTNQQINSWGGPDTGIGWEYQYSGGTAQEQASDKLEITGDVNDDDFPDYRGLYLEQPDTLYKVSIGDLGYYNKHVTIDMHPQRFGGTGGGEVFRYHFGRGNDTWVGFEAAGAGSLGPDRLRVVVNGVTLTAQALGDSGGVFNLYRQPAPAVTEFYVFNNHIKVRVYQKGTTPPAWPSGPTGSVTGKTFAWYGETWPAASGTTDIQFYGVNNPGFGQDYTPPWLHKVSIFTVEALGAARVTVDAFIKPYFTMDAVLIRGGVFKVDAFVQPYFTIDARIVIRTESSFTIDALIPLNVVTPFSIDAFVKLTFTINAQLFAPTKEGSFPMDAAFVETEFADFTNDAVIRDLDRTYSFTAGATKEYLGDEKTFTLDAAKNSGGSFTLDALLAPGIQIYAIKKEFDLSTTFTVDAAFLYWADLRSFYIDAYIIIYQTGSFTIDAWKKQTSDEYVHWDDFNNRTVSGGLGVPSFRGSYSWTGGQGEHSVSSGQWHHVEPSTGNTTNLAGVSGNVDREIYWEWNRENNYGPSIGNLYVNLTGNLRLRNLLNGAFYYIQYGGSDTAYYINPGTTGWVALRFSIYNHGKNIKWKLWNRASSEPALWQQWIDADALGWNLTDSTPGWLPVSQSWFGQGNPPWDHYLDNIFVSLPSGAPYSFTTDASKRAFDITNTFKVEAFKGVVPFTMDAFVQPWFRMDARIWLGTGFPMDAVIRKPDITIGDPKIGYDHKITNSNSSWTHNPPANAKMLHVTIARNPATSVTYGNIAMTQVPSTTEDWYISIADAAGRDDNIVRNNSSGQMSSSIWLTSLSDIELVGRSGSYPTMTANDTITNAAARAVVYRFGSSKVDPFGGGAVAYTEAASQGKYPTYGALLNRNFNTNPILGWSSAISINTNGPDRYSITAGVVGGPIDSGYGDLYQAAAPHTSMEAWIAGGGKFLIQAWKKLEAPLTFDAIKKAPFSFGFTMDAARFDFGTQNRTMTMDAIIAPILSETQVTQLGWLQPGRLMWGDVTPEVEQLHFTSDAVIKGSQASSLTIDAYLKAPYLPEVLESILGDMQLGEDGLGWALKAFTIDAIIVKTWEETFTADAIIVSGYFRIDALLSSVLETLDGLWYAENYDESPDNGLKENIDVWVWERYG